MKGFGTDEKTLIQILCQKDPLQIAVLRQTYARSQGRDLLKDLESELGGSFEEVMMGIVQGPLEHDCYALKKATNGFGTDEETLNNILLGRSNADMAAIKQTYPRVNDGADLEADLRSDLSMITERHFMMVIAGNRAESSAPVIPQEVDRDVMEIYKATEGKTGTDELLVCQILTSRNDNQIRAIAQAYHRSYSESLEAVIKSVSPDLKIDHGLQVLIHQQEFSGHMQSALLRQIKTATDPVMRDADMLEEYMSGFGTKKKLLTNRVINAHWDRNHMSQIKDAYKQKYGRSLKSRIEGETSGDYERGLVACLYE